MSNITEALTFDDVLILPAKSDIKPSETDISARITKNIKLKIPIMKKARSLNVSITASIALSEALRQTREV